MPEDIKSPTTIYWHGKCDLFLNQGRGERKDEKIVTH
jgi:hypothetical protein